MYKHTDNSNIIAVDFNKICSNFLSNPELDIYVVWHIYTGDCVLLCTINYRIHFRETNVYIFFLVFIFPKHDCSVTE